MALPTVQVLAIVRLLSEDVPLREIARRTGVTRVTVTRVRDRVEAGDPAVCVVMKKRAVRLRTFGGREVTHEEVLNALARRAAVEARDGQEKGT